MERPSASGDGSLDFESCMRVLGVGEIPDVHHVAGGRQSGVVPVGADGFDERGVG